MATSPSGPMWLAHHWPDQYERCVEIAGRHVCRRCAALYPASVVVAVAVVVGIIDSTAGLWLIWLAPIPAVVEWWGEHLGSWTYVARRQIVASLGAAASLGVALGRHALHPFEVSAVAAPLTWATVCVVIWLVAVRRRPTIAPDWEEQFERDEAGRAARLEALVGAVGSPAEGSLGPDYKSCCAVDTKSMSSSTAPTSDGSRSR